MEEEEGKNKSATVWLAVFQKQEVSASVGESPPAAEEEGELRRMICTAPAAVPQSRKGTARLAPLPLLLPPPLLLLLSLLAGQICCMTVKRGESATCMYFLGMCPFPAFSRAAPSGNEDMDCEKATAGCVCPCGDGGKGEAAPVVWKKERRGAKSHSTTFPSTEHVTSLYVFVVEDTEVGEEVGEREGVGEGEGEREWERDCEEGEEDGGLYLVVEEWATKEERGMDANVFANPDLLGVEIGVERYDAFFSPIPTPFLSPLLP